MGMPDFLVIGAPKAGSTALHTALDLHPQLFLANPKEPKFFLTDGRRPSRRDHRGPGDAHSAREWVWRRESYEQLFDSAPDGALTGESTPFYLWDTDAHARMHAAVPDAKLIAILRDPIVRAYSNWCHLWCDGLEPESDFLAALERETARAAAGYAPFWRYLGLGRYGEQLASLLRYFPREQVHVLRYRDLVDAPAETLDDICRFLGVETGLVHHVPDSNVSTWVADTALNAALRRAVRGGAAVGSLIPPRFWRAAQRPLLTALHRGQAHRPRLHPDVRRQLVPRIREDVQLLESLLGRDFQAWLSDSDRGTYAVRRSFAPSALEASQ